MSQETEFKPNFRVSPGPESVNRFMSSGCFILSMFRPFGSTSDRLVLPFAESQISCTDQVRAFTYFLFEPYITEENDNYIKREYLACNINIGCTHFKLVKSTESLILCRIYFSLFYLCFHSHFNFIYRFISVPVLD